MIQLFSNYRRGRAEANAMELAPDVPGDVLSGGFHCEKRQLWCLGL